VGRQLFRYFAALQRVGQVVRGADSSVMAI
jgi:hypothetical protein